MKDWINRKQMITALITNHFSTELVLCEEQEKGGACLGGRYNNVLKVVDTSIVSLHEIRLS